MKKHITLFIYVIAVIIISLITIGFTNAYWWVMVVLMAYCSVRSVFYIINDVKKKKYVMASLGALAVVGFMIGIIKTLIDNF
jgi:ABC-type antimicrobial peptide transport system permease subunit